MKSRKNAAPKVHVLTLAEGAEEKIKVLIKERKAKAREAQAASPSNEREADAAKTRPKAGAKLTLPVPERFTEDWIKRVVLVDGENSAEAFEPGRTGLVLRFRRDKRSGATRKAFYTQKKTVGMKKRLRVKLGDWPTLTLAAARAAIAVNAGKIAVGADIHAEREAARIAARAPKPLTLAETTDRWEREALTTQSQSYQRRGPASLRRAFGSMMRTPAADLNPDAIERVLDDLTADTPAQARQTGIYLRTALSWAAKKRLIARAVRFNLPPATPERERVLTEEELRARYEAGDRLSRKLGNESRGKLFKLVLLAGVRRNEFSALEWTEIFNLDKPDRAEARLPGPKTKTGAGHWIPLSEEMRRILLSIPHAVGDRYVFPGARRNSHFASWARLKREIDAELAALGETPAPWVVHDIRRSLVTILAGEPYSLNTSVLDKLLGHSPTSLKGAAKVYQRQEYQKERRAALEVWSRILRGRGGAKVIPIASRGVKRAG